MFRHVDPVTSLCYCRTVETVDLCCRRRIEAVRFSDEGTGDRLPGYVIRGASVRRGKRLRCHYRKIVAAAFLYSIVFRTKPCISYFQ